MKTIEAAQGRWRGILLTFGLDEKYLTGKHGPCPLCQGRDRYRWDDKNGHGTYYCSGCGAGTGMKLLQKFRGWDFKAAAREVDAVVGNVKQDERRSVMGEAEQREMVEKTLSQSRRIQHDDPAGKWLSHRGLWMLDTYPADLRFHPSLRHTDGGYHPAMIGVVRDAKGEVLTLHRTYLTPQGTKAKVEPARKFMASSGLQGGAIRLSEPCSVMGIAEGIETALAATHLFGVPCWAATNATLLQTWNPPSECKSVIVFGDNDTNYTGQAAAYALAKRLSLGGYALSVHVPSEVGSDFNDVLLTPAGTARQTG